MSTGLCARVLVNIHVFLHHLALVKLVIASSVTLMLMVANFPNTK